MERTLKIWSSLVGFLKFNADKEIRGKSGLGIGGVFSMDVEVKDSSEEKVLAH